MKIIGFTGTREGMTHDQRIELILLLSSLEATYFIHGDCIGADEQAHYIAIAFGCYVGIRPCTMDNKRAFCEGATEFAAPKPPLDRNRDIVQNCDLLIAMPKSATEERRSGTWATVRYAREAGKEIWIIGPKGELRKEPASPAN